MFIFFGMIEWLQHHIVFWTHKAGSFLSITIIQMSYSIRKLTIVQVMRGRATDSWRRDSINLSVNVKMISDRSGTTSLFILIALQ